MISVNQIRLALVGLVFIFATPLWAGEPAYDLDIEPQPLVEALKAFAEQSGLQVVYYSELADGENSPKVSGTMTADQAMTQLLASTDLKFDTMGDDTVVIEMAVGVADDLGGRSDSKNTRPASFVMAKNMSQTTASAQSEDDKEQEEKQLAENRGKIETIVVVGTRNTGVRRFEDDAQPYIVLDREQLDRSNAQTLGEFLSQNLNVDSNTFGTNIADDNRTSVSLRGLGTDETLILVDGRRLAPLRGISGSPGQPDLNGIPVTAIERIEVLPTTASGIYGGGATGGVINIVLRRDYRGLDVGFTYGNVFDGDAFSRRIDVSGGANLEDGKTSVNFSYSFQDATELLAGERDFIVDSRNRILENNPSAILNPFSPPLGFTTNIGSASGDPLVFDDGTVLPSNITFVPVGYAGFASDNGAGLFNNAGQYNLALADSVQDAGGGRRSIRAAPEIASFIGSANREFTHWIDGFVEAFVSENTSVSIDGSIISRTIDADAPGNPFAQDVTVTVPTVGFENANEEKTTNLRFGGGFIADIPSSDWFVGLDYTWNKNTVEQEGSFVLDSRSFRDAAGLGEVDVFRDVNEFPIDFSRFRSQARAGIDETTSTLEALAVRSSGLIPLELPGGRPTLSLSAEYRWEEFADVITTVVFFSSGVEQVTRTLSPERSQEVGSLYAEALFPIVSQSNEVPWIHLFELQTAIRYDAYKLDGAEPTISIGDDGLPTAPIERFPAEVDSIDPTFGMRFAPVEDVTFRASYGTGFLPPNLAQIAIRQPVGPFPAILWSIFGVTDPLRGDELLGEGVFTVGGGNPDLKPEESESLSFGLIFEPRWIDGLRLTADWTRIVKENAITSLSSINADDVADLILNRPDRISRGGIDPADGFDVGPVTQIDASLINLSEQTIESFDFKVNYTLETDSYGEFVFDFDGVLLDKFESQLTPSSPLEETSGTRSPLDFRATASLAWLYDNWAVQWSSQYYDDYKINDAGEVNPSQGGAYVDSQIYHDLFVSYAFPDNSTVLAGALRNLRVEVGVNNVLNTTPPFDASDILRGISPFGDNRLARYTVSLRKSF